MNEEVGNGEILFIYDAKLVNPNGDPLNDNAPRMMEGTNINIVSDVRLKRTIRDYLHNTLSKDIFVFPRYGKDGNRKTREDILKELGIKDKKDENKLKKKFIDLRLFGATIAGKGEKKGELTFSWIGPVQFRFGHSLNEVNPMLIEGTTVMPSGKEKAQGTFTEYWVVPYSLIAFYGTVNCFSAKETGLTNKDLDYMFEAMWNGTKFLDTHTKVGQTPRFLLYIIYKNNVRIGDLDYLIKLNKNKDNILSIGDYTIDISKLLEAIDNYKDNISEVRLLVNGLTLVDGNKKIEDPIKYMKDKVKKVKIEMFNFEK